LTAMKKKEFVTEGWYRAGVNKSPRREPQKEKKKRGPYQYLPNI